ncbi:MAG: Multi-sensor signal transduction histidine kinase [Patescibacteria group bacterium]|nr:Multi-sensor signal transduction histidine kinase [Patescibacteria group bacterium]
MKAHLTPPVFDRDEYFESSSRTIRWICLVLVLITFPFDASSNGLVVMTMIILMAIYNGIRYNRRVAQLPFFNSRMNSLAVDHVFVLSLAVLSGGLSSPYYPLFFLLIIAVIASFGIAGFAFSLSAQVFITLILLKVGLAPLPNTPEFQFIIKLVLLVVFSLVAEQSVRSRDEEYLLESRFTRRIENERQRLLSLINSLSNAVLAVDAEGKVYLYNAAALELLNTNRDISGNSINELLPLQNSRGKRVNLLKLITHDDHAMSRQDLQYEAGDGSKMILDLTVSPVHVFGYGSDNWGGYMVVFRDITKQKSLDEERDEFISVASHELRTPLAIAEANLSTALLPGFAKIDPKAKKLLNQTHENIVFLGELIQDLTTLSRAERGALKLNHEIIDTRQFLEQLARDYRAQAEAKQLKLETKLSEDLGNLVTSEHELHEILQNFLTNAIKYTDSGTVTLEAEKIPGGVQFAVSDTGIGISASDKSKIFTKFYRSEDFRTRQTGGTGLGLYITHKLAEKLNADITFTSRLNHGSTFRVSVPNYIDTAEPEKITASAQAAAAQPLHRR